MPLFCTPQIKLSKEKKKKKYKTQQLSVEFKLKPLVISNAQQCETMEHFWVCPLQREPSAAKYSSCRKYVKGSCAVFATARQVCAQSLWLCRNWRKEELLRYFLYPFWYLILIFGKVFDCICASIAPTYYITSASLSYLVGHVTEVVWIILQGNGNSVGEQSQDHKSQSSWKSNRSACLPLFMPWASLLQPGICAMDWNPSRLEWLTYQLVERLKLTLPPIYTHGSFWLGM